MFLESETQNYNVLCVFDIVITIFFSLYGEICKVVRYHQADTNRMQKEFQCLISFEDAATNRKKLFQQALLQAKHGKVLYILPEELNELPELSQDISSVSRHYIKMINFLYVKNVEALIESVCTLPEWQNIPSTIILDDLSQYCNRKNIQNACGLVALILDTNRRCSVALKAPCRLYISITKDNVGEDYCNILKELYSTEE